MSKYLSKIGRENDKVSFFRVKNIIQKEWLRILW